MSSCCKHGRPEDDDLVVAFERLLSFLREKDECHYSLEGLLQKLGEYLPNSTSVCSGKTLRQKLRDYFGDDVIMYAW